MGRLSAEFRPNLAPKTPPEGRGSSCSAGCTKNQPRRPILRPFRGSSEFTPSNEPLSEGSLAGFCGLAGPGSPARPSKMLGASPPTFLKAFPGPRGRPDFKKTLKKSGQIACRYPVENNQRHVYGRGGQVWSRCGDRDQEIQTTRFRHENV